MNQHDVPDFSPITAPPPPREDGEPHRFIVDMYLGERQYDDWTAACTYAKESTDPYGPRFIMHITIGEIATICQIWDRLVPPGDHPYSGVAIAHNGTLYIREGYTPE